MARRIIETEEGQPLQQELAAAGSRAAAALADVTVLIGVYMLLLLAASILALIDPTVASDILLAVMAGLGVGLPVLWFSVLGALGIRSPGKRLLGLYVTDRTGAPATALQHLLRSLFVPIEYLPAPLPVGLMLIFLHPEGRRLGDMAAGTLVLRSSPRPSETIGGRRQKRAVERRAEELVEDRAELFTPARLARLERRDREFLTSLLMRRGLRSGVRKDLFREASGYFAERLGVEHPEDSGAFLVALDRAARR